MTMHAVFRTLALAAMLVSSGCIGVLWLPDGSQGGLERGFIPADVRASFVAQRTTRADVVSALGAPDWISGDEQRLAYQVCMISSHLDVYLGAGGTSWMFGELHNDLFEFGIDGRLQRYWRVTEPHRSNRGIQGSYRVNSKTVDAEMERLFGR